MSTRIGRSCFSRGKQLIRSFRRRHSFDPSSFLLCQPASLILVDFRGKRNGGYQMYGNKEEAGLNSGGVDAPLKGRRWMLPLLPLPHCIVEPDTFHYVPLCPADILSCLRFDSQIGRNNRYFPGYRSIICKNLSKIEVKL